MEGHRLIEGLNECLFMCHLFFLAALHSCTADTAAKYFTGVFVSEKVIVLFVDVALCLS